MWQAMAFPWLAKQAALVATLAALAAGLSACAGPEAASAGPTDPDRQRPAFTVPFEQPDTPPEQPFDMSAAAAQGGSPGMASSGVDGAGGAGQSSPVTSPPEANPEKGVQQANEETQTEYAWQDGDRTLTVTLQTDLVLDESTGEVVEGSLAETPSDIGVQSGDAQGVRSADAEGENTGLPVFKSSSGALMTLPGGVLLLLDQDWSETRVNQFFADNGIALADVSELDWIDNGYFIETAPGFPSLTLANALAGQDGVELSSPNWAQELELK